MSQVNSPLDDAQADPGVGCVVDAPHRDAPLVITFGFVSWDALNGFDFDGRTRKLQETTGRPLNRILVRDTANLWYQHGVTGLGTDVDSTAASLRDLIARIQPTSISTVGQSMGAYAAILFGALLNVDRVLAFGPLSYLKSEWARRDGETRWLTIMDKLDQFPPKQRYDDLPALLERLPSRPAVHVVVGTAAEAANEQGTPSSNNLDSLHAARFAKVPGVSVQAFPEASHGVVQWLIDHQQIDGLLETWLLPADSATTNALQRSAVNLATEPPTTTPTPAFTDTWRTWISDNLSLGSTTEALLAILVKQGFNPAEAQRELDKASRSPYMATAMRLAQRVAKREWVLNSYRKSLDMGDAVRGGPPIDRRHKLSRAEFYAEYYCTNRPVVITGMMEDWPAMKWTPETMAHDFADRQVEVQTKRNSNSNYEKDGLQHKQMMSFGDFMRQVIDGGQTNDIYMTANNFGVNRAAMADVWKSIVQIPEYLDASNPGNQGYLWVGPAGTVTPTHHDLTNNIMSIVTGRKRILLVDGLHAARIYNDIHVYTDVDLENIDYERFPAMRDVTVLSCDLGPGELLFIPVGWWHHVRGLEITVSVTFINLVFDNDFASTYRTNSLV